VLLAFDPRARGDMPVGRYQAAAEKFGWIVAGSNNSRNGPAKFSLDAAKAMETDVEARFSVDPKRLYATGQSGGARFAIDLVGSSKDKFAGVIPSSAGWPPGAGTGLELPFVVFGTAGTEDFNYLEITRTDRVLDTPHRIRIFEGGHTWPPSEVAVEALEWMEIQAMRTGARPRDEAMIDRVFNARKAELEAKTDLGEQYYANKEIAADFKGLRDVSAFAAKAEEMTNSKAVIDAVRKHIQTDMDESQLDAEILNWSDQLDNEAERAEMMEKLSGVLHKLGADAHQAQDSPERRKARRILSGVMADNASRQDAEYRKLLDEVKP
jgi:predicted esterase